MSATNRGAVRKKHDFYATPSWCTRSLIENIELPGGRWCEPCAGDGAIIKAINDLRRDIEWSFCEIREECRGPLVQMCRRGDLGDRDRAGRMRGCGVIGDFLSPELVATDDYDVIITNPPFKLAREVIERSMVIAPKAMIVMLLRVNFLGSDQRAPWLREYMPDVHVMPNRPVFCKNKHGKWATDATEYAWFVWHGAKKRSAGKHTVLPPVPRLIRMRDEGRLEEKHGKPRRAAA